GPAAATRGAGEPRAGVLGNAPAARRLTCTPAARLDLPDKVFGKPRFLHDVAMPGLLHARVLKPASPGARLIALDEAGPRKLPGGVAVLRDGSFAGVVADTEAHARAAFQAVREGAQWRGGGTPARAAQ